MKKFMATLITVFVTIFILAGAAAGVFLYHKYAPSKELASQTAWFGVSGDEVAVFLDNVQDESVTGRYLDGQVYLPLNWVIENLNERFYWDEAGSQLIYTLPESIVYADAATKGSNGKPLFVQKEDQVWLMTGLITTYTDLRMDVFDSGEAKRIFVDTSWDTEQASTVKKDGKIRVRGGVKSDILTDALAGSEVTVLENLENWTYVRTGDGFVGYIQNKCLGAVQERTLVSTFQAPEYTNISMEEPVIMVWHQVTSQKANDALEQLTANTRGVNVISPTWFMLTANDGSYESLASQSYVDKAHAMGMQVWAAVDNFNKGDNVKSEVLFASTAARKKLISSLMDEVQRYKIDGINLDIESIKPEAGPHYVQFIRELSVDCRKNGIVLSVDNTVPTAYSAFYNRAEQGRVADYVVIMGYDEHTSKSEAGSVASIGYEKKGIEDTLAQVPKEKIISGIPFFTRLWKEESGKTTVQSMGISAAKRWVEENKVELYWQEELGQYYGELQQGSAKYSIWMEEERSIGEKMKLIKDYDLAGVACWKLGFEPADLWDVVTLK